MLQVSQRLHLTNEHPEDVLRFQIESSRAGMRCAIAMITNTIGGAVRAPGAIMAITEQGSRAGYLSGGCIDADIVLHAQAAMKTGKPITLQYGQGSPFLDITLPCGGAITVSITPSPNTSDVLETLSALEARQEAKLTMRTGASHFTARFAPRLRLRIAGRSADPIALARLAIASDIQTILWSADEDCLAIASSVPELETRALTSPSNLPKPSDDAYTAFVLMMHDIDWEPVLLQQALAGPAFYIGAVGSPKTHSVRCASLVSLGTSKTDIARIRGPIGLVPSMRNATTLAISTLAEIISTRQGALS